MADVELKNLPPQERIKRLKEMEEKKKKEIEEAQKLIKDSEKELNEIKRIEEKIPIPQVAKVNLKNATLEEKEFLKAHSGMKEENASEKEDKNKSDTKIKKISKEVELEQLLGGNREVSSAMNMQNTQYALGPSQIPMKDIYREMKNIYLEVGEKGYLNREEETRIRYLSSAVEKKLEDVEAGKYSLSEDVATAASLTQQISSRLSYRRNKDSMYQR